MLAKEVKESFDDKGWLYEIKWDGYRAIAEVNQEGIKFYSRNGLNFSGTYSLITNELKKFSSDVIIDGEIVVLNDEGLPSFQLLQHYNTDPGHPIKYYVFDLLHLNGHDTYNLPLLERKKLLKEVIPQSELIVYSDHLEEEGKAFFDICRERNLEGIMAKKCDSQYYAGRRTNEWLKIKHNQTAEAIIAGFTAPTGLRQYFGALILATKAGENYTYIGHTGSGFNTRSLKDMWNVLQPLITGHSPFNTKIKTNAPVTWVKPELVCEIKFTEKTNDGKLRHPIFLHLREDKKSNEVTTEKAPQKEQAVSNKTEEKNSKVFTFGNSKVVTSNPTKIYFPDDNVTKQDVIEYYISVSNYILPYLKGRPESLLRNPGGINDKGFFHKDAGDSAPDFVKSQKLFSDSANKDIDYIICDNQATLTYMNNLGCIEINPWHSTLKKIDYPDYFIIDIDPSDNNTFSQVVEVALATKKVLDKAGAECYCKTSGSSGLHIYIPAGKKYTYEQGKDFALIICTLVQEMLPDFTTLERNLKKRGNKHIYLDYLQNRKGQTISCVYSLRPKRGATVSTPLFWKEVNSKLDHRNFTINNTLARIKKTGDIFSGVFNKGVSITKCLKNLSIS
jgi:bifunctional non-homologous end joining protein LigD